jgi:hypothetical protein
LPARSRLKQQVNPKDHVQLKGNHGGSVARPGPNIVSLNHHYSIT